MHEFPGAHHVFDWPLLARPMIVPMAQTTRDCVLEETSAGLIVNQRTGARFSYADSCVQRGATLAYDANAFEAARNVVRDFIRQISTSAERAK